MSAYKRLIFHFYAEKNYKENRAIKIHLNCLKYYSHIFDEALFCIAIDDAEDKDLYKSVEKDLIDCGFKDIRFKEVKNDVYREARTFYEEVARNMSNLDGMTFFGHTKGYTNYIRMPNGATVESLDQWITGLYYFSLNNVEEVEQNLFGQPFFNNFYGSFLSYCKIDCFGQDFPLYSGTFFWVNGLQLSQEKFWHIPKLDTLAYAENFLSKYYFYEDFSNKCNHRYSGINDYMAYCTNYYYYSPEVIPLFFLENEEDLNKFIIYKNKMTENA